MTADRLIVVLTESVVAFSKPKGMLVHGNNSLETIVTAGFGHESAGSLSFKPGPLHRLDRNTSGLIVFSRNLEGARSFPDSSERLVSKYYIGLLDGTVQEALQCR